MQPLVSVVIPVYNGTNYMREAIDSALGQTYPHIEVIVVNDGSTDGGGTEEVALSYGDKIRYYKKENGGVATAVNFGIGKMRGEYFSWLSHDDVFYPDKIENQMRAIEASGGQIAISHGNFDFLDMDSGEKTPVDWLHTYDKQLLEYSCFAPVFLAVHGSTVLIHRRHFERVGLYDTTRLATQDSEFLFRVMRGQKSVFVEKPLIIGRLHKAQGQRTMREHRPEYNRMFVDFCEALTAEEKTAMCGSEANFYFHLLSLLKTSKPADMILDYLEDKLNSFISAASESGKKNTWEDVFGKDVGKKPIFIFGAGQYGRMMLEKLRMYGLPVCGFLDNDGRKQGRQIEGLPCFSPQQAKDENGAVVVAMLKCAEEVLDQLQKMGIRDVFMFNQVNRKLFRLLPVNLHLK